jgi:hypothetical protein
MIEVEVPMKKVLVILIVGMMSLFVAPTAFAVSFGFGHIVESGDDPSQLANGSIGEAQLELQVTESGDQALFTFINNGPELSSITDVYFDDDTPLLEFSGFQSTGDVVFSVGASPENLPGGGNVSFSADHSYDSDSPIQQNGVNPGESLGLLFGILGDGFDDILAALYDGTLDVGLHVQGFDDGGSEAFTVAPVPEPSTVVLLGMGMIGLVATGRKKFKKQ